jgi:hypothetical protein
MPQNDLLTSRVRSRLRITIHPALYLHYAFDLWVNVWRKKWAHGEVIAIRYAEDSIFGFQHQTDADRFLENCRRATRKVWTGVTPR